MHGGGGGGGGGAGRAGEAREWPMARYLNGISQEKRRESERGAEGAEGAPLWTDAIWP